MLRRHSFEVPERLVQGQTERLTRDFKTRLLLSGTPESEVDAALTKFIEQLRTSAQRYVRLGFLLERIAQQESISVSQSDLMERLWQLAQRWKKEPTEVKKLLDAKGLWPSVLSTLLQEKTMAFLMNAAVLESEASTVSQQPSAPASPP